MRRRAFFRTGLAAGAALALSDAARARSTGEPVASLREAIALCTV